ncbi:MAG: cation-translocating P-type ATPase [Aeromonadaceae bacterium]
MQTQPEHPWHTLSPEQTLATLASQPEGLTAEEARRRLDEQGPNRLTPPLSESALRKFLRQFQDLLIYVLIVAALLSWSIGHWTDGVVIFGVIIINALFGYIQEGKAQSALAALRNLLKIMATVLRQGQPQRLDAEQLVCGDVILLESGDKVPADLRLLEAYHLQVQESALTGESMSVEKQCGALPATLPLAERSNMLYAGTLITQGRARAVVVATADNTELGKIGQLLQQIEPMTTPLMEQLAQLGQQLTRWIVALATLTFLFGWLFRDYQLDELFMAAVGIAVAAIPEGLPAVITITLAVGVQRMAAKRAIVRRLPAVETLGSVTVICTDKTGTLTANAMMVQQVTLPAGTLLVSGSGYQPEGTITRADGSPPSPEQWRQLQALARVGLLCNDARLTGPAQAQDSTREVEGDPTEASLLVLAEKAGVTLATHSAPRLDTLPFESSHGYMVTLHGGNPADSVPYELLLKGAPERLFPCCQLSPQEQAQWQERVEALADQGLRVLALAVEPLTAHPAAAWQESWQPTARAQLLGLVGLADPPRPEARAAIAQCHEAGIRIMMITGDHAATALAIGRQLGLASEPVVMCGQELEQLDDAALAQQVKRLDILARATPTHKLRVIQALQGQGGVIAMTGDGVNDAPALKRADVGVAMGRSGTEAAKEAAAIVLADDNFATLRDAVSEGRAIYENLRRALLFLLPTNGAQALVLMFAIVWGMPLPISPVQILWVNMVSAIALSLPLAFEPASAWLMRQPPRPRHVPILPADLWLSIFVSALLMAFLTLVSYLWALQLSGDQTLARTLAINVLIASEILFLINCRQREQHSFRRQAWLGNPKVGWAVLTLMLLQAAQCYLPWMNTLFATTPLPLSLWLWVVSAAMSYFLLIEAFKAGLRAYQRRCQLRR